MDDEVKDRRRDARFRQPAIAHIRGLLRPGSAVVLVDLSAGGALVQVAHALRPGSRVCVQLAVHRRSLRLTAHVLRCSVASLDAQHGVRYHGALKFEQRCTELWNPATSPEPAVSW